VPEFRLNTDAANHAGAAWQVWWELNKEWFIGLARRDQMPGRGESRPGGPFLGRGRRPDSMARPFAADFRVRLIRPDLEVLLEDENMGVRRSAALALGQLGDPRSIDALTAAVGDGNTDVRDTAILALGMLRDGKGVPALTALLRGGETAAKLVRQSKIDDQRRATAALGLGLTGKVEVLPALAAAAVRDQPRAVRSAAIFGMGLLTLPEAEAYLARLLSRKKTDIQLKALAATALGKIGGAVSRNALLHAIDSSKSEVRRSAALALGHLEPPQPARTRLETVRAHRRSAKSVTPDVIAKLDATIKELEERAKKERAELDRFEKARRRALRIAALGDAVYSVRQFAAIALGQVGVAADRGPLIRLLEDKMLSIRPFAALGLGILGGRGEDRDGTAARVLLFEFEATARLGHRAAFAVALGLRGWRDAGASILARMKDQTSPVARSYYAIALGMLGYTEALEPVVDSIMTNRNTRAIQQAAMAYGLLANQRSADYLAKLLDSGRSRFDRQGAGVGLALYGRPDDLRRLSRFIRDRRNTVVSRAWVAEGLGIAGDPRDPNPLAHIAGAYDFYLSFTAIDRAIMRKW